MVSLAPEVRDCELPRVVPSVTLVLVPWVVPSVSLMLVPEVSEVPLFCERDVPRETPSDRPSVQPRDSPSVLDFVQLFPSDCCLLSRPGKACRR